MPVVYNRPVQLTFQLKQVSSILGMQQLICNETALYSIINDQLGTRVRHVNASSLTSLLCGRAGSQWYSALRAAGVKPTSIRDIANMVIYV